MKKLIIATVALAASTSAALAHPGEHVMSLINTVVHLMTEPDHLAMIVVGIVVVGVLFYKRAQRSI
jgi:hydrogenase/urease accessory protein HupE